MVRRGLPLGLPTPNQPVDSWRGTVSPTVGNSGIEGSRSADVTASARILPPLMWPADEGRLSKSTCTWPEMVGERGAGALVGGVQHLAAGHGFEQLAGKMHGSAAARGSHG